MGKWALTEYKMKRMERSCLVGEEVRRDAILGYLWRTAEMECANRWEDESLGIEGKGERKSLV